MKQVNWSQIIFWDIFDHDLTYHYEEIQEDEIYDMILIE